MPRADVSRALIAAGAFGYATSMRLGQSSRLGGAVLLALVATYGIGRQAYGLFVPTFRDEFDLPLDVLGVYASAAQAGYLVAIVVTGMLASGGS